MEAFNQVRDTPISLEAFNQVYTPFFSYYLITQPGHDHFLRSASLEALNQVDTPISLSLSLSLTLSHSLSLSLSLSRWGR
jgi:hypothetical protein